MQLPKADLQPGPFSRSSEARALVKKALRRQGHTLPLELIEELERENAGLAARMAELEGRFAQVQTELYRVRAWVQDFCGDICDHIRRVQVAEPVDKTPAWDETAAV
jgi:hypothetical protein